MSVPGFLIRKSKWKVPSAHRWEPHVVRPSILEILGEHRWQLLDQVMEEPKRRGALLDLTLTGKAGMVGRVKVKENLDCSGCGMS